MVNDLGIMFENTEVFEEIEKIFEYLSNEIGERMWKKDLHAFKAKHVLQCLTRHCAAYAYNESGG